MGLFTRTRKERQGLSELPDEVSLLKYVAGLTSGDIDKIASAARTKYNDPPEETSKSLTDYYSLLQALFGSNTNSVGNTPHTRNQRYEIYDEMDESTAYISSALDILSDDATQADENGIIIHVKSESDKVKNLVDNFIKEFELEDKISKWARAVAKYGDLFIRVEGEYEKGLSYINDTIYPGVIDRRDLNGKLLAFSNAQDTTYSNTEFYAPWDFVHFRHKGDIYREESNYSRLGLNKDSYDKNLTSAYGQSILRPAIKVYAQLRFVENMILLSRLTNSIRRNIFLINVGEVAPDKAYETLSNYARLLKKNINFNIDEGIYSSSKHTVNYDEDIFIPVGDPQNDVRIESVGGDANIKEQYDLEYLLNKLFSAIKVPKAYLNYEQDLNARSTLVQLDIRYARSVSQLQTTLVSGLRRLISIHLAYLGLDPQAIDLDISLTKVSAIDEESRIAQRQTQITAARDLWDLLISMKDTLEGSGNKLNLLDAAENIMQDYLEIDQGIIDSVLGKKKEVSQSSSILSHVVYSGDFHAMYPNDANKVKYKKLVESFRSNSDKTD